MQPTARVAIYYAPRPDDPLTPLSAAWLGRDPASNAPVRQPAIDDIDQVTADPRRYGFHATLKPPMRLRPETDWFDVVAAVQELAATLAPFRLPPLVVSDVHGFLALRETSFCAPLQLLADRCVEDLDRFRAPATDAELERRRKASLTAEQDAMLLRWGYPYVFGTWFFHMTLTRRLNPPEKSVFMQAAEGWFAPALAESRDVRDICLFTQANPGADFTLAERIPLSG